MSAFHPDIRLPRDVEAVIFDMDGVIFDTEQLYQTALIKAVEEVGCVIDQPLLLSLVGMSWANCQTLLHERYKDAIAADNLIGSWLAHFEKLAAKGPPLKAGVLELLQYLDDAGMARAIATSAYRHDVDRNLDIHGLTHRFDAIVAHGDCPAAKPAPDPFIMAAALLEVAPPHCVAIEGSVHGIQAASDAGTMTIMIPDLIAATQQEIGRCVCIASDLHEVRAILQKR